MYQVRDVVVRQFDDLCDLEDRAEREGEEEVELICKGSCHDYC